MILRITTRTTCSAGPWRGPAVFVRRCPTCGWQLTTARTQQRCERRAGRRLCPVCHQVAALAGIEGVEIIPGKGSGALKKKVLRFLDQKEIKQLYHRVEKDGDNWGRLFVHFRFNTPTGRGRARGR